MTPSREAEAVLETIRAFVRTRVCVSFDVEPKACCRLSDVWASLRGVGVPISGGVYIIIHLPTKLYYIGSATGKDGLQGRLRQHVADLRAGRHANIHLLRAVAKHGPYDFCWAALSFCASRLEAIQKEQTLLDAWRPWEEGVGFNMVREARPNAGLANSPLRVERLRAALRIFHANPDKKALWLERRRATNKLLVRAPLSAEHRRKLSEAGKGRIRSPEAIAKCVATRRARANYNHTSATRAHLADKSAKHFTLRAPDGTVLHGYNMKEFAVSNGLDYSHLQKVLCGRRQQHKGWTKC